MTQVLSSLSLPPAAPSLSLSLSRSYAEIMIMKSDFSPNFTTAHNGITHYRHIDIMIGMVVGESLFNSIISYTYINIYIIMYVYIDIYK